MKKLLVLLVMLVVVNASGQWQPEVRLTNNPGNSLTPLNNSWCIASNGNIVHTIWYDDRDGNYEIYYKRTTNSGVSWGSDIRLTNNTGTSYYPSIFSTGPILHVAWYDNRDGNTEIYYKRSTDGGDNWGPDVRLTNNSAISQLPSVSASGSNVFVLWYDDRDSIGLNTEIYYKRSTDGGSNWGQDTRLTAASSGSYNPSISISGQIVHVAWYDTRGGYTEEIYYKRSTDLGISWSADLRITNNSGVSKNPQICALGSTIHLAWTDRTSYHDEIYYKRSTDGGLNWGPIINLSNYIGDCWNLSFSLSGSNVHAVWYYSNNDTVRIYYKRSTDEGVSWGANIPVSSNIAIGPSRPSISVSNTSIHIIWCDSRDGNKEIYYKCDPTGNLVGIENPGLQKPTAFSLGQNYPNPFNPTTKIMFSVAIGFPTGEPGNDKVVSTFVKLVVYDVIGREVQTLVNESLKPGTYETTFDGSSLNSGVYFYKLFTDDYRETKKMLLIK